VAARGDPAAIFALRWRAQVGQEGGLNSSFLP
jgi:hypothetical protein